MNGIQRVARCILMSTDQTCYKMSCNKSNSLLQPRIISSYVSNVEAEKVSTRGMNEGVY